MHHASWRTLTPALLLGLSSIAASAQTAPPATAPPAGVADPTVTAADVAASPLQAVGPQAGFGDLLVLGTGARFQLAQAAADDVPIIDGTPVTVAQLAGPWQPGRHAVALQAPPQPGGEPAVQPPLHFVYDPGPPTIQWEVGDTHLLDAHGLDQDVHRDRPPRHVIPERDRRVKILWSPDGRRWLPLLPKDAHTDAGGALADWVTAADRPQVFLWALSSRVLDNGAPVAPQKLQLVRIWAGDELSAVRDLRLRVLPGTAGGHRLEMVATDLVGNATTVTWPLAH
ncbi:MAG TPA: hypothetical protein VGS57_00010 [Thermoanaerobaculia bacterium]|jgi:hypothetical protein|nr:hypothetical protein [Thermoanaerobaculia bacterium]